MDSICGSPLYCSPEILLEFRYIGPEVDVWSCGVILYAMVTGCIPWEGSALSEQVKNASTARFFTPKYLSKGNISGMNTDLS